jgi:hypothetical protein
MREAASPRCVPNERRNLSLNPADPSRPQEMENVAVVVALVDTRHEFAYFEPLRLIIPRKNLPDAPAGDIWNVPFLLYW